MPTNNVFEIGSLPENQAVFEEPEPGCSGTNLQMNQAETAARLKRDSVNLNETAHKFLEYLSKLREIGETAEREIT